MINENFSSVNRAGTRLFFTEEMAVGRNFRNPHAFRHGLSATVAQRFIENLLFKGAAFGAFGVHFFFIHAIHGILFITFFATKTVFRHN